MSRQGSGSQAVGLIRSDLERINRAESILGYAIPPKKRHAILSAHNVGNEELGKDGKAAQIGNYTFSQIRRKATLLQQAGFNSSEIRNLMQAGVVGKLDLDNLKAIITLGLYGEEINWGPIVINEVTKFVDRIRPKFDETVISYTDFGWTGYSKLPPVKENILENVRSAIETAMSRSPGKKVIIFNLDNINLTQALENPVGLTDQEMQIIVNNKSFFRATRWYKGDKELTDPEVESLFRSSKPDLFDLRD